VYRIASVFGPAGVLTPNNAWPATSARVAPVPLVPFLTMKNGPGNNGYAVAHEAWSGVCWLDPSPLGGMDCIAPSRLYNLEGVFSFWGKKDPGVPVLSFATVLAETIAFADPLDLGGGRRVWCGSRSGGVLCIASSHGPAPGSPQFNNPQQAAHAAAMNDENRGIPSSHSATLTGNLLLPVWLHRWRRSGIECFRSARAFPCAAAGRREPPVRKRFREHARYAGGKTRAARVPQLPRRTF
jgi:hypothetical protein